MSSKNLFVFSEVVGLEDNSCEKVNALANIVKTFGSDGNFS